MKTGDPKYLIENDRIINAESKIRIPDDEPIFILRAKDKHAIKTILYYRSQVKKTELAAMVKRRVDEFDEFREQYPNRMKEPD